MEFFSGHAGREQEISELFEATFAASEGGDEGKLIAGFVDKMMNTAPPEDLFAFSAYEDRSLVGCIFFSRLTYERDDRTVFILSPVAVRTDRQKQGIGQQLLAFGLEVLRRKGIDIAVTYGDPNYYAKVGFRPITERFAKAPLALSHPQGWLGLSLSGKEMQPLAGQPRCVEALNNPKLW